MSVKRISVVGSALACLAVGSVAAAQDSSPYLQVNLGANIAVADGLDAELYGVGSARGHYNADTGIVAGLALGKGFGKNLRGELELASRQNDVSSFKADVSKYSVDGSSGSTAAMVNAYYDFGAPDAAFRPYIGGGLGYANVQIGDNDAGAFAYQGRLGVSHDMGGSSRSRIGAEAVYFGTSATEFDVDRGTITIDYGTVSFSGFFRQSF